MVNRPRGKVPFTIGRFAENLKKWMVGQQISRAIILEFSDGVDRTMKFDKIVQVRSGKRLNRMVKSNKNLLEGTVYDMKVAVLGTGFGAYHVELYAKMEDVEKIVVWGRNEEKRKELKEKFHVEITDDMEVIWNDSTIDLVDICLPNHLHKEAAIKALCAGKDVFIETPVAESLEDAEAIFRTAERYGRRAFVDLFLRFEYPYEYLYHIIKDNKLGALRELRVKRETPPWWGNLDSEHIGLNLMIHDMDFVTRLLGEPEGISVSSIDVRKEQSTVSACLQYEDACAFVRGASAMPQAYPFSVGYEAILERGTVRYYEDGYSNGSTDTKLELFCDEKREEIPLQQENCYENAIKHVVRCIREHQESCLDIKEAIRTLKTVLEMNQKLVLQKC